MQYGLKVKLKLKADLILSCAIDYKKMNSDLLLQTNLKFTQMLEWLSVKYWYGYVFLLKPIKEILFFAMDYCLLKKYVEVYIYCLNSFKSFNDIKTTLPIAVFLMKFGSDDVKINTKAFCVLMPMPFSSKGSWNE